MTKEDLTPTPEAAAAAARLLAGYPDYRVLFRLREPSSFVVPGIPEIGTRVAAIVDVETTGLVPRRDRIIELAILRVRFTDSGQITKVDQPRVWREDPGFAIEPAITRLTGLTEGDLVGQSIDDTEATALLQSADVIIAHSAQFDAGFVEARLPEAAGLAWACTLNEIDWAAECGFVGRQLGHLLTEAGYFFTGHRAEADVVALLHLLAHQPDKGPPVLAGLVARAETPSMRIEAIGAPISHKDILKARGYRWNVSDRYWWTEVATSDVDDEQRWLARSGCTAWPRLRQVTWRDRHR